MALPVPVVYFAGSCDGESLGGINSGPPAGWLGSSSEEQSRCRFPPSLPSCFRQSYTHNNPTRFPRLEIGSAALNLPAGMLATDLPILLMTPIQ